MKFVPETIASTIARNKLLAQKASPEILLVAGIVGAVGSTVLACRATLKMEGVLDNAKEKFEKVAEAAENHSDEYSESDKQKDTTLIYVQTGVEIAKLYGPAIILGAASIAALVGSNRILNARNTSLAAAYAALDKGFREYRSRVISKYGEDVDRDMRYGTRKITVTDEETGKRKTITRVGPGEPSIYARFFDEGSSSWNREPEYNLIFLNCQQNYANDLLHSRGHIFLNEVYDMLGIPRSKAGCVVGWVLSKNGETDNFVNFGVFDGRTQIARDFVNGFEGSILLDFNVDGVIYDRLEE